jgi:hypothetical protein
VEHVFYLLQWVRKVQDVSLANCCTQEFLNLHRSFIGHRPYAADFLTFTEHSDDIAKLFTRRAEEKDRVCVCGGGDNTVRHLSVIGRTSEKQKVISKISNFTFL